MLEKLSTIALVVITLKAIKIKEIIIFRNKNIEIIIKDSFNISDGKVEPNSQLLVVLYCALM